MFCEIAVLQAAAREQSDLKKSGVRWRLYAGSEWLLLPLLTPTVQTVQTFVAVWGWIWPSPVDTALPSGVLPVVWLQASISQRVHQPSASSLGSVGPLFVWSFGVIFLQRIYLELIGHNTFNPSLLFVSLGRQADDADRLRVCCGLLTQLSVLGQSVFHLTCVDENPPQLSEE